MIKKVACNVKINKNKFDPPSPKILAACLKRGANTIEYPVLHLQTDILRKKRKKIMNIIRFLREYFESDSIN